MALVAAAEHDGVPRELVALPALVAIHGKVAADDGGDLGHAAGLAGDEGEVIRAAGRRGVAAIGDGVDEDVGHARVVRGFDERDEVILVAVHAAIGDEAEQMEARAFAPCAKACLEHRVAGEVAFGHRFIDAREILVNDAAGAEIEVADFGVAHLAFRQADVEAAGAEGGVRVRGVEAIVERRVGEQRGVAVFHGMFAAAGIDAPAIANDQNYRFGHEKVVRGAADESRAGLCDRHREFGECGDRGRAGFAADRPTAAGRTGRVRGRRAAGQRPTPSRARRPGRKGGRSSARALRSGAARGRFRVRKAAARAA